MTVIDRQKAFSVVGPGFPSLSWSLISMAIYGMVGPVLCTCNYACTACACCTCQHSSQKLWHVTWQPENLRQALYEIVLITVKRIMRENEAECHGVKMKCMNPTNLKQHLMRHHKKEYQQLLEKD